MVVITNEELLDKIFCVEATACEAFANVKNVMVQITEVVNRLNSHQNEIERIRSIVDEAIIASVHELIEYLHYNDIQDLDEEEFSVRVRRLIFESDPAYCLPF